MSEQQTKVINKQRLGCSLAYFALALLCFVWILRNPEKVFYADVSESTWHLYRLLWCAFAALLGFGGIAFALRYHPPSPFPTYITYYPAQIALIAVATHGLLHCFEATSGFVFYYLAFAICLYCGYYIDFWQKKIRDLFSRSS